MPLFEWPALGWLALAVVSAIVEVSIPHFGLVFVAIGAVGAAAAAALALSVSVPDCRLLRRPDRVGARAAAAPGRRPRTAGACRRGPSS